MNLSKTYLFSALTVVAVNVTAFLVSCTSKSDSVKQEMTTEIDTAAMHSLQGIWQNEYVGNVVFEIVGDSIYYNDSICVPAKFFVKNDTMYVDGHPSVSYIIKDLDKSHFVFVNTEGEEVSLVKTDNSEGLRHGEYSEGVNINQGIKVKRDSVMYSGNKRYHAYSQVNPTTYKVYRQNLNSDGLAVETVYYDNIVYICVYDENGKLFGRDMRKKDFVEMVPQNYLSQAVLSEILIDRASAEGVQFVAVLAIPDTNTNFRVNILITPDGQMKGLTKASSQKTVQ